MAEAPAASPKDPVIREILETETRYLESLRVIQDVYFTPLFEKANGMQPIIKLHELHGIFLNIEDIILVAVELEKKLRDRVEVNKSSKVGDIFLNLAWGFNLYRRYASEYEGALTLLAEVSTRTKMREFITEATANPATKGMTLESFLVMPVQRIPRYKLLLAEAFKHTKESDEDYTELKDALDRVSELAMVVNEAIRSRENMDKLRELGPRLRTEVVKIGRVFVKEGRVTKICRKTHKKYLFVLFNDMLAYKSETDVKSKTRTITLVSAQDLPDTERLTNAVELRSNKKSFIFYTDDAASKTSWVEAIKGTVSGDGKEAAPVWTHDKDHNNCTLCNAQFTVFFRKHHCRNCGALVCSKCSGQKARLAVADGGQARVCNTCYRLIAGKSPPGEGLATPQGGDESAAACLGIV